MRDVAEGGPQVAVLVAPPQLRPLAPELLARVRRELYLRARKQGLGRLQSQVLDLLLSLSGSLARMQRCKVHTQPKEFEALDVNPYSPESCA